MKKALTITSLTILTAGTIVASWIVSFYLIWSIVFTVCSALSFVFFILTYFFLNKWHKACIAINIAATCVVILFSIFYYTGLLGHFSSIEATREWFESFGVWAWLIFFLIQVAQVVILPIPAQITTIAGALIFGPTITFFISSVAIILGSMICFAIGKTFGVQVAYKIASKGSVDKYRDLLTKKGRILLPVMFLFPAFPDDLLCFVAGTTKMSWLYFFVVTIITRLIGIACICYLGSGELIPYSGWGIPVWIVLVIFIIAAIVLIFKYQEQIEEWIIKTFTKNGKKKLE